MAKQQRDLEKERFWRLVVDEHRQSGLTVRDFCRREGVSEASFYAWRRELRQRDGESTSDAKATAGGKKKTAPPKLRRSPALVEVVTRPSTAPKAPTPVIEILTPTGFTLRLTQPVERDSLDLVLGVLATQAVGPC